ncbi:hypothetical protein [Bifidobacterium felsineum]|uniref:hypothetical protein n=1 Tax=Bifidobacterium felsineum TaxID=2045440 RepID=UPI001BDC900E|nr:hypothetical protein [Bifidobacterium felsineum]MBT1164636.1 hypothetical protein [Bifidobacterium felsineum]
MGHVIRHTSVEDTETARMRFCEDYAEEYNYESDGGGGCTPEAEYRSIDWRRHLVFDSYDKADEYLNQFDGRYVDVAVLYADTSNVEPVPSRLKTIDARLGKARDRWEKAVDAANPVKDGKTFHTCPYCKSRISLKHLSLTVSFYAPDGTRREIHSQCPVCRHTLLSETACKRIDTAAENMRGIVKDRNRLFEEARAKAADKAPRVWLVKTEYHC